MSNIHPKNDKFHIKLKYNDIIWNFSESTIESAYNKLESYKKDIEDISQQKNYSKDFIQSYIHTKQCLENILKK